MTPLSQSVRVLFLFTFLAQLFTHYTLLPKCHLLALEYARPLFSVFLHLILGISAHAALVLYHYKQKPPPKQG